MKITQLIKKLEAIRDQYSDNLEVYIKDGSAEISECMIPDYSILPAYSDDDIPRIFEDEDDYYEYMSDQCESLKDCKLNCEECKHFKFAKYRINTVSISFE